MEEIWKDVPGYEGYYQVSSLGLVGSVSRKINSSYNKKRVIKGRSIKLHLRKDGYYTVTLSKQNIIKTYKVADLIAATFIGKKPGKYDTCHNNGIRTDNRINNLRYDTRVGNLKDKILHGTSYRGERHWYHKLKEHDVRNIKNLLAKDFYHKDIADIYGVHRATISAINQEKSWAWIN